MRAELPKKCVVFRETLERSLRESTVLTVEFSWHEHLSVCVACRRLLEEEKALDSLLSTLPLPELPKVLVARVLARLEEQRDSEALDQLLELDHPQELKGLSERIKQELSLDRLLERDRELDFPAGLSARVLAALEGERESALARVFSLRTFVPVAASLLALLGLFFFTREEEPTNPGGDLVVDERPSSEMLALLDVLGDEAVWEDELWANDEAIDLALELDESDELLLEYLAAMKEEQDEEENG
jgi:hypothetical protein